MIKIRDLKKDCSYNGFSLECRNLDVPDGNSLGVYGDTGSGKTLFGMLLAGILKNYSGSVQIDMTELKNTFRKKIGYLPFNNVLYTGLTVQEMSKFLLAQYKIRKTEYDLKVEWFDQFFRIKDLVKKRISVLSGGELQTVKLFTSLIHSPSVLIIDEPFNGLGSGSIGMFELLYKDLKERNVSIISFSCHEDMIKMMSDAFVSLIRGKIE